MNISNIVGLKLEESKKIVETYGLKYEVVFSQGRKDSEILDEPYVIRTKLIDENTVELLVSNFSTRIKNIPGL